ncbi:uncharacterized protein TRIADDRAFT_24576 [Trichoplax adhaerens]|uniref:Uncharacterized protein n=1 Tax=Trichoplax adhaerens TaxID=10228 RepID=B3RTK8_TRIAD|nr:hypothetical protein TRIADDRAFT_24576 [Trichoplax adhaerens]EDV26147.1 hypothetical protein TRIADDRAFT_24576 [Trichoplax adhaerens]|eukprot:XP_002112180.1 hypothetical protein TRIADDRAFT_24576 [Trichoplax adhaerens]
MASNQESLGDDKGGSLANLSKWQVALLLGVGVGVGAAYYYYRRGQSSIAARQPQQADVQPVVSDEKSDQTDDANMSAKERASAVKGKGNKFFKGGKYEQAIRCYTEAIELCPSSESDIRSVLYQNRAAAYEQLKEFDKVVEDCNSALELNKHYVKAINRRSRAYEELKEYRKCLEDLTAQCILESFQNAATIMSADRVLKIVGKIEAKQRFAERQYFLPSTAFIQTYLESFANGKKNNDIILFNFTTAFEEDDYFLIARYNLSQCNYENIIDYCTKEIDKDFSPYRAEAYALRGTLRLLMTDSDSALEDFDKVLEFDDGSPRVKVNALIKRASYKLQQEKTNEAIADFSSALELDPENCDIYYHRGQAYFLLERLSDAMLDFQKSYELNENFSQAYVHLGYARYKSAVTQQSPSLVEKSIKTFEDALEKYPNSADAVSLYAQILQDQQQLQKADELFDKAISIRPNFPSYYVHKGVLQVQLKQDIEAGIKLIEKAIELDNKCDFAYETLATVEVQRGNIDRGIELFEKALNLARAESDLSHTLSLLIAAQTQIKVGKNLGVSPMMPF